MDFKFADLMKKSKTRIGSIYIFLRTFSMYIEAIYNSLLFRIHCSRVKQVFWSIKSFVNVYISS